MLDMLEKELNKQGVFENNIPEIVKDIANSISVNIPFRMKLTIAVSELILFVSHFRRNILHWNGSNIPINAITFCIAKSGASKDSSVKAVRKCFKEGYEIIEEIRKEKAIELAIEKAREDGKKNITEWAVFKDYYTPPNPLFVAPSTAEGFIQHLNDLDESGIGGGFMYSGEFGSELANNNTIVDNIRLLSELYDEGNKEVKVLKDRTNQSKAIENLPVSALFIGSQDNILLEENIKRKFKTEFTTKLARRSFFNYSPEEVEDKEFDSIGDFLAYEKAQEEKSIKSKYKVSNIIKNLTESSIQLLSTNVEVDQSVRDLFILYKRYNTELAESIDPQLPISKLTRTHLQWKALKLSGALAVLHGREEIVVEDYKAAIEFVELLNTDMIEFEKELGKESYEVFVDFANMYAKEDKLFINLHTLRKMGYIPTKGTPLNKMKDLTSLASAYDPDGIYTCKEDGILFEKIIKTDKVGVSFVEASGTKADRKKNCSKGYEYYETTFDELALMLEEDLAYTPFRFKDGIRGKDNIVSGCKWITLDVDNSNITDKEAHVLLSDINHHIARTSDKENSFKFRILIELDSIVDIPEIEWKFFIESISKEIGIDIDLLPKAQIFFSFSDREVLSIIDQEPLQTKEHVIYASNKVIEKTPEKPILASNQQKALLKDPRTTFAKAFEAKNGEGSRKMIWAAKYAKELGATRDEVLQLVTDINEFWTFPLPKKRFNDTIISQIKRWSWE